jgi:integrase
MATVIKDPGARKRLQFVDGAGKRQTVHLGAMTMKQADAIKIRVEQLLTAKNTRIVDHEASEWAANLDDRLYDKLAAKGVVAPREQTTTTLSGLWDAYLATLSVKPQTKVVYEQARKSMEEYFGAGRALKSITVRSCAEWRQWMVKKELAEPTIAKRIKVGRAVLKVAVKWKMIRENPLEGVRAGSQVNRSRMYFLTRADAERVLEQCPDAEWRAIFVLSRFGGLRCPSEHLALRWSDIDWDKGRMTVRAQKTEAHEHGGIRQVPLFPEIRSALLELFEQAPEGAEFVITRSRDFKVNIRTQFRRIIQRAGLTVWPRLFHSLRGSRATELCEEYPQHVVCRWLGHSVTIAQQHYLSVTDDHFARAAGASAHVGPTRAAVPSGTDERASAVERDVGDPGQTGAKVAA